MGQGHYREAGEGGRKQGRSLIHFEPSFIRSKSLGLGIKQLNIGPKEVILVGVRAWRVLALKP